MPLLNTDARVMRHVGVLCGGALLPRLFGIFGFDDLPVCRFFGVLDGLPVCRFGVFVGGLDGFRVCRFSVFDCGLDGAPVCRFDVLFSSDDVASAVRTMDS